MTVGDGIFWSTVVCFGSALEMPLAWFGSIALIQWFLDRR